MVKTKKNSSNLALQILVGLIAGTLFGYFLPAYGALAVVFVAQVYGVPLDLSQQIVLMFALMISTKGLAAVPGAVLIVIAGAASAFGLPAEGIALLLGIDRILDMGRTTINLVGNCMAAIVVAAWEKEFNDNLQSAKQ